MQPTNAVITRHKHRSSRLWGDSIANGIIIPPHWYRDHRFLSLGIRERGQHEIEVATPIKIWAPGEVPVGGHIRPHYRPVEKRRGDK